MPYGGSGSYSSYLAKQEAKGGFKVGDRVRILPQYKGKTYASKMKRSGEWILKEFKTANWVLKRPDDYTGYYKQGLLAKAEMFEKVEVKAVGLPKSPELTVKSIGEAAIHDAAMWVNDKPMLGDIVIVKDPHGTIPSGKLFMVTAVYGITVDVTQLFTGVKYAAMKTWLTVLPEKDLTITYLPK